jgi:hypothetical protein
MAAQEFESIEVPIARRTRWRNIGIWSGWSALCGVLILIGVHNQGEHNGEVLAIWASFGLIYTLHRLVRAIFRKTERQLTKEGWIQKQAAQDRYRAQRRREIERGKGQLIFWIKAALAVAFIVLAVAWLWRPLGDEAQSRITVYPEHCVKMAKDGKCTQDGWRTDPPTTYTVHTDQQFVVGLTDEESAPHKLFNCVIADKTHWTCTDEPNKYSDARTMSGSYFSASDGMHYVSRFEWLADHMNND